VAPAHASPAGTADHSAPRTSSPVQPVCFQHAAEITRRRAATEPLAKAADAGGGRGRFCGSACTSSSRGNYGTDTVSTDDAYVNGHVTFVAPRVPGQVSRVW
jgi:multidrug resistance efflux pump